MRALFLMAILATLLVIANKKPDQTAWEAAHELKQDAQDAIAEVKKEPIVIESAHDVAEQYANFEEMLNNTLDGEAGSVSTTTEESSNAKPVPEVEKLEPPAWIADAGTSPEDPLPEPADAPEKATPPPSLPNLPDLSPAPATRAPLGESETAGQNPAPPSRLTFRKDYGDVKSAYERASRFLAEIK
jgi:hypothetical protein